MKKMKCCVVIDGNWLFMSRFSVMTEKFRVPCNAERAKNELKSSLMTSVQFLLEQKKFIDGVVICADGKSWRKDIPRPELQNIINPAGGYKRNRVRGEELDWKSAFAAFNDFLDELEASAMCRNSVLPMPRVTTVSGAVSESSTRPVSQHLCGA